MANQKATNDTNRVKNTLQEALTDGEALEQSSPAEASGNFGPDIGIPSNYEANQVGQKKSLSGFEVSKNIGRL